MRQYLRCLAAGSLLLALSASHPAWAQKRGGILRLASPTSPANMSIHETGTIVAEMPMMGVFNNLIVFDQHKPQVSLDTIVSDLATSWSWNEDDTALTFQLRQDVKWHDGKPFTAADVKCTWDLLLDKRPDKLRLNPRKTAYENLTDVTTNGNYEVTFKLKRPQAAFPMLLAGGFSAIYPCHLTATHMRQHPIGTGPFKFVEFKPNEHIKVTRNSDYWKQGRPYLDGIEYKIIPNVSTRLLSFVSGKFDFLPGVSIPLLKDVKSQAPDAICRVAASNINRTLGINRDKPPFDNRDLRRAMTLSLDRQSYIDILTEGQGDVGGVMMPAPEGIWGMPPDLLRTLPGYDPDIPKNRAEGRRIMEKLGYGPDRRLAVTVSTRNIATYRDTSVILIDQLKEIYIDGVLEPIDTVNWYPRVMRKDFTVTVNVSENSLDDPDPIFYQNYVCGAERNYTGYCNPELDQQIDRQSMESNPVKRRQLVWEIERKLAEDDARPIIFYLRGAHCWHPQVKGLTIMVNGIFNGSRFEDLWLDN